MLVSHSNNITLNNTFEVIENHDKYIANLEKMRINMRGLATRIYFYVEKQPKSGTLISRYQQLINKRNELLVSIKKMK